MKTALIAVIATLTCVANASAENETTIAPETTTHGRTGKLEPIAVEHYNRAVGFHQKGFLNQAITEYQAAIKVDGRLTQAWCNLGGIYTAQGKDDQALATLEKAMAINPKDPVTLSGYGQALYNVGRFKDAIESWRHALEIDPKFKGCAYNLATALRKLGRPKEAEEVINKYGLEEKDGELLYPRS
jgi:tetratricopeptide (TPR) repeat protein